MNRLIIALALILAPFLCPFWAHAQAVDGEWKKDLQILSNPAKMASLQKIIGGRQIKLNESSRPQDLDVFAKNLESRINSLNRNKKSGGVDSGGGGNLILFKNGDLKLLDFVANSFTPPSAQLPRMVIPQTPSLEAWGIDRLDLDKAGFSSAMKAKVAVWEKSSPFVAGILKRAIGTLPVYVVDYEILVQDQNYFLPSKARSLDIQGVVTAALYVTDYGLLVSKKYFERLDYENQLGLLLHESLRHVQLTFAYANSSRSLQNLTVALMRGPQPGLGESLDSPEYLDGDLLQSLLRKMQIEVLAVSAIPKGCLIYQKVLKKICPIERLLASQIFDAYLEIGKFLQTPDNGASDELMTWVYNTSTDLFPLADALMVEELMGQIQGAQGAIMSLGKVAADTDSLDLISKDFNKRGHFWGSYKSEARTIIKNFKKAGIFK
jgi:hypothetical protein